MTGSGRGAKNLVVKRVPVPGHQTHSQILRHLCYLRLQLNPYTNAQQLVSSRQSFLLLEFDANSTETQEVSLENCNNQIQQHQMGQSNALSEDYQEINSLDPDLANFDGIWDIGFPSLLPIDIDSHSYPPPM